MKRFSWVAAIAISILTLGSPVARAEILGIEGQATNASVGLILGASTFNESMGTHALVGLHADYKLNKWFGPGLLIDYSSLGSVVPGVPNVTAVGNGNFYITALQANFFAPGFLSGLSLGPAFGFSTYNTPSTTTQGSTSYTFMTYGGHVSYDVGIVPGMSLGAFGSYMMINTRNILGFTTSQLMFGGAIKFWF